MIEVLQTLFAGDSLSERQAYDVMTTLTSTRLAPEHVGAFLGALRAKGETAQELTGFARAIMTHCEKLEGVREDAIDVCGTGGDGGATFNISTAAALVLAGGGVPVAKHGNRAVSSASGSADVLEQLGVAMTSDRAAIALSVNELGFGFLFAPHFHSILKTMAPTRASLGVRTTFNLLGPLMNPAGVRRQVVGVFDRRLLEPMALALSNLGCESAMIVASHDGMDEFSLSAPTTVVHLENGALRTYEVTAAQVGLSHSSMEEIRGGDATTNAAIITSILDGKHGAHRDVVVLNAAAGFVIAGRAATMTDGVRLASTSIDSGAAATVVQNLQERSRHVHS